MGWIEDITLLVLLIIALYGRDFITVMWVFNISLLVNGVWLSMMFASEKKT